MPQGLEQCFSMGPCLKGVGQFFPRKGFPRHFRVPGILASRLCVHSQMLPQWSSPVCRGHPSPLKPLILTVHSVHLPHEPVHMFSNSFLLPVLLILSQLSAKVLGFLAINRLCRLPVPRHMYPMQCIMHHAYLSVHARTDNVLIVPTTMCSME